MQRRKVALAVAVAVCAAGCGGGAQYGSPKQTFETAWRAAKAGDRDALIACFDQPSQATLREIEQLRIQLGEVPNLPQSLLDSLTVQAQTTALQITAETIQGDRATLQATLGGTPRPFQFAREGAQWKIDAREELGRTKDALEAAGATEGPDE